MDDRVLSPDHLDLLGHGPAATGGLTGWSMDADIVFRCIRCGDLMPADPDVTATCRCGALHKDADAGRFGSVLGDDAIEVFGRRSGLPAPTPSLIRARENATSAVARPRPMPTPSPVVDADGA